MNLFSEITRLVVDSLAALQAEGALPEGLDLDAVTVEPPRDAAHGDMATNAAMVLAKPARRKPRDIAALLAERLAADDRIASAEVAGPGFLNLRLAAPVWHRAIRAALTKGAGFGQSQMGAGRKVNVEYVSANPTGPLHVGHTRGAVFGDALASLLAYVGHEVTREYYINDGGAQVDVLARSVYLRYLEAHGQAVAFEDGTYPGDYLKPVGEALMREVGAAYVDQPEAVWLAELRAVEMGQKCGCPEQDIRNLIAAIQTLGIQTPHYRVTHTPRADFPQFIADNDSNFAGIFQPDDWASQLRAMIAHDIAAPFGDSLDSAATIVRARVLVIVSAQDHIVNPEPALAFARMIGAETLVLDNDCGHLSVSCEMKRVIAAIAAFLEK